MHNWRLLLFAFLAVIHPIASFTERNLVDGREQCCDRRNNLFRDTRLTYGTRRLSKLPEDRSLSRGEIREDRRYEVRTDDSLLTRPTADRRLVGYRTERDVTRSSPELTRFTRATDQQRMRVTDDLRRERSFSLSDRETSVRDTARISRDTRRDERSREIIRERHSRDSIHQNDRENRVFSHRQSGDNNRVLRSSNDERQSRISIDTRRETRNRNRDNSGELRRIQENRETRNVQRTRDDVTRTETPRDREDRRILRESVKERRTYTSRSESRVQLDNRESRSLERRVRERSSPVDSRTGDRVRNIREEMRMNLRDDTRDERNRLNTRIVNGERFDERRHLRNRESMDRRLSMRRESRERTTAEQRKARESGDRKPLDSDNARFEKTARRESRNDERQSRSYRVERAAPETRRVESRGILREPVRNADRRSADRLEIRETKRDARLSRSIDMAERDMAPVRTDNRITRNNMEREKSDSRYRSNVDFARSRYFASMSREKTEPEDKAAPINWQYLLYTLQGIYLCSILTQMVTETGSDKKKSSRFLSRWTAPFQQSLIKVD